MSKTMLVNVTHVEESRVAVVDDGILQAYEIETINRTSLKGNIHNAVVESVHASLEAAFVHIGPDLKGFLPIDEVNFKLLPVRAEGRKQGRIGQHLSPGQKLMVQVVREPFAGKPPTVSTYFSLPGRFLVLMPGVDSSGVSRKIEDPKQRDRLKKLLNDLRVPEGFGVIVRTAGVSQTKTELQRDLRYLLRLWESIQKSSKNTDFPGRVYREADLVIRTIRDHFTPDIKEVWIDSEETHGEAMAFMRDVMPSRAKTLQLYSGERPLFNKFNLEDQIERIYKRRVPLPSGGEIVIDGTEALTAVDVNSARARRQKDLEENAVQTNVEAAVEIARQLRLRDLGGLIVVDFIDMSLARNKTKVEKAVRDAMKGDKAKHDITRLSKLGLMEIARQRIKGAKMAASYATCAACDGHGLVKNVEAAALSALRKLQTRMSRGGLSKVTLGLPPEVATWVLNTKREEILRMEQRQGARIEIEPDPKLLRHETRFETEAGESVPAPPTEPAAETSNTRSGSREKVVPFPKRGAKAEPAEPAETETADADDGRGRRRKRRRRRGKPEAQATEESETGARSKPESAPTQDGPDVTVPRGIRSDELMPAAAGRSQRARKSGQTPRARGGRSTRKRGSRRGRSGSGE